MIVFALMISLLGVIGFSLRGAWQEQAFRSQAERLVNQFRLSQDMMLLLNIDTEVEFREGEVFWIPVGTSNETYEKMILKDRFQLTQIASVDFRGGDGTQQRMEGKQGGFKLGFFDRGFRMSKGILTLTSNKGEVYYILLNGYPSPINLLTEAPNPTNIAFEERDFYERMTTSTWNDPNVQKK